MSVRIDAASPLLSSYESDFQVAHSGRNTVVLRPYESYEDDVVVTTGEVGLMPGGIHYSRDVFEQWRARIDGSRVTFRCDSRAMEIIELVNLRLGRARTDQDSLLLAVHLLDRSRPRELGVTTVEGAKSVANQACDQMTADLAESVHELVGSGEGSTPAGDDLLVGVCAALRSSGLVAEATLIAAMACDIAHRTTRASRLYLRAAEEGRFAERVHLLAGSFAHQSDATKIMKSIQGWGASSGLDLATGMLGGLIVAGERSASLIASST
ncbi:MAG: DUF2877 domain-containing protein [Actinomycetota bacterium]|nr:DUF2877 domain-containing protein [Actinomycetota bacterium]MDP2287854.1 DUF2877 domain-containing protein [Actinomycetota bacterium]